MKITFMGSGTSMGVPTVGCTCSVCQSSNSKNKRTRPSVLLQIADRHFLIDTATDLRQQAIREGLKRVDAVLYTHSHADHILGLDDLRPFNFFQRMHIPCFGNEPTMANICEMFKYVFTDPQPGGSMPRIEPRIVDGPFEFLDIRILPLPIFHGRLAILGYRIGKFSYITDCSEIPDDTYRLLDGTHTLVLGVLRYEPHPTHLHLEKALQIIERVQPERAYFTHISHAFDHDRTNSELPSHVQLSFDGLSLEMEDP
jgi:phosphoribosyl 1,2-cyclic phosphate phosphodiesterase